LKRPTSTLALALNFALEQRVRCGVVAGVDRLAALGEAVERRHREIEMALVDQPRHLPVEERDQQRGDMRAVDVGVGHDDDAR
jgi:hypothetical protein